MGFTVAGAGTAPPARKAARPSLAPLGKIWKDFTSPGVYEPVKAVTADGEWIFERMADGTWMTGHLPTRTVVKARRSLRACRAYAASGKALEELHKIQARGAVE